ncbi:MAG: CDGSH iron-sulfur domain-containing protein [Planctomycetes bacterium]|nr:CDGSH iron-sulfur domain-containing protein [Planctomycetota bacterium]
MSDEAEIGGTRPVVGELAAGEYFWCTCGRSKNQPYCDGSHAGTTFRPQRFELTEAKKCALCTCKRTANGPYCDGAHAKL